jgi:hypothetical protein
VLALAALAVSIASGPGGSRAPAPDALLAALSSAPAGGARAAAATRPLVGAPYVLSALGEGSGPDADPRFRLDAFDCLGFLETAIALGSSRSLDEAARALDDVRYQGAPALDARNHEVQAQWLPANVEKGWLVELTRPLAGERAVPVPIELTPDRWRAVRAAGRAIDGLPSARQPMGRFELWAVPPEALATLGPLIPDGTAIVVVREDEPARCTRISHVGLVVAGPSGERLVRHATAWPRDGRGRVIEEPLAEFAVRQRRARPGWPLVGFALFGLPDASVRVAALRAADPT